MPMPQMANEMKRRYGMTVTVFKPTSVVLADLNIAPSAFALAGTSIVTIEMSQDAQDQAFALGVFAKRAAFINMISSAETVIVDRGVLLDAKGRYWLIHGLPRINEIGVLTISVRVLVSQLILKPDGLP
jgi:hypothetical protein